MAGPRRSFSGGAGLLSTTADYTRFLEAIRRGGGPILSRKSVELMTTDNLGDLEVAPGLGFGLGFGVVSDPGVARRTRFTGRVQLGWRVPHVVLGGPGRETDRRLHDPDSPRLGLGRLWQGQGAGLPGDRLANGL